MKKSNNFSNVPKTLAPEEDEERNALIRKLDICKFEFSISLCRRCLVQRMKLMLRWCMVPRHIAAINLMRTYGSGC